jgi:flagellar biosynthesis protein FlhB
MADLEGKTEQATEHRLQQAREEGQVAVGHDAALVAAVAAGASVALAVAGNLQATLLHLFQEVCRSLPETPFTALPRLVGGALSSVFAICGAAALASLVTTLAQTRAGFWPHLALPDASRLFQAERFARMLSKDMAVDLALAAVKVLALGWAGWSAVRDDFMTLGTLLGAVPGDQLARTLGLLSRAGARMLAAAALLAGLELALTRFRFNARMRMTRDETKREFKQDEGDPLIRSRRRRRHRELARGRAAVEVPRADALVVNPTHVAVSIRYRRDEGRAPRVTSKGKGVFAEHMRTLARANGVPIVQDVPLARLLYRKVKLGGEIPAQTYRAVAAILAFVYRLTGRVPSAGARA